MKYSERINKYTAIDAKMYEILDILDEMQNRLDKLEQPISLHEVNQETYTYCTVAERQFLDELKKLSFIDEDGDIVRKIDPGYTFLFQRHFKAKLKDVFK